MRRCSALLLLLTAVACSGAAPVPVPDLADAEPLVRQRIEEAAESVRGNPERPGLWGRLGEIYDVHRYADEAVACYEQAQQLDPEEWRWPYYAGLVLRESDRAASQQQLSRAFRLRPDYAPLSFYLGLNALLNESLDEAEGHFRHALQNDPRFVNALLGLTRVELARGTPAAALEHADRATRIAADEAAVHEQRAQIHRALGDSAAAELADRAAREAEHPAAILGFAALSDPVRGEVFLREGVSSKWLRMRAGSSGGGDVGADLRSAIDADPDAVVTRLELARTLRREGKLDEARREIEQALRIDPEFAESYAEMGNLFAAAGQIRQAAGAYQRALQLDPGLHEVQAALGTLMIEAGALDDGLRMLRDAAAALPGDTDVQQNLAAALAQTGQFAESMQLTRSIVERRPDHAPSLVLLGTLLAMQGQTEQSVEMLRRAVEADPNDVEARMELGRSLWELGRHQAAIASFNAAAARRPNDPEIARELAWSMSTSPVAAARDGAAALKLAGVICERSGFSNPMYLDVLAAAQAETGDYAAAVGTSDRALQIIRDGLSGMPPQDTRRQVLERFARELQERRAIYQSGAPFRQPG